MSDFETEIKSAILFGDKELWAESEEHAKSAIQINKKDPRGYQYAAKAATMLEANDRAFKFLQLGAARCSECKELAIAFEKFKQQQEASKQDRIERVKATFDPQSRKPGVPEKVEKKEKVSRSSPDLEPREIIAKYHQEGYEASSSEHFQKSLDCFRRAQELYKEYPQEKKTEIACKFVMNLARIGVGSYEALAAAYEALLDMAGETFPAGYYALAMVLKKLNRAKQGLEITAKGLKLAKNVDLDWETYYWPSINEPIKETRRVFLKEKLVELSNFFRVMPAPDAVCRLPECHSLSSHVIPCINIYCQDPDFVGYIVVHCESKCSVAYHVNCWKHYKENISELEKISDKDMLGKVCPTEGCRTGRRQWRRSIITKVTVIDQDGKVKAALEGPKSKDPEPPPKPQPVAKKTKPVKKPGDKVFMKPKKTIAPVETPQEKAEREKAEKERYERDRVEREAAEKARAERVAAAGGLDSDSDDDDSSSYNTEDDMYDSEAEIIPIEDMIAMVEKARENNFYRKAEESNFDPTLANYGHESAQQYKKFLEIEHDGVSDSKEVKEQKLKLQRMFHELFLEKGPMLREDMVKYLQDLKLCSNTDYFLKEESSLPHFLLSTAHFCSVDEYVGLANQMDKVFTLAEEAWNKRYHYAFKNIELSEGEDEPIATSTEKSDSIWDDEVVNTEILEQDFGKKKKKKRKQEVEYEPEEDYEEALQREMELEYEEYLEDKRKMELEKLTKESQIKANNNGPVLKISGNLEELKPIESANTNGFGKMSPDINNLPNEHWSEDSDTHGSTSNKNFNSYDDNLLEEKNKTTKGEDLVNGETFKTETKPENISALQNQSEEKTDIENENTENTTPETDTVEETQNNDSSDSELFESDSEPAENEASNESSDDSETHKEEAGSKILDPRLSITAPAFLCPTVQPFTPSGSCTPPAIQSAQQTTSEVHNGGSSSDESQNSKQTLQLKNKLESAEKKAKLLESQLKEAQKKETAAKLKIDDLTRQLQEMKQEKNKLSRSMDEQANKFKNEKKTWKESATKELEAKEKQHTAWKNQLVKNNETQKNQIAELTTQNTSLKSTIENLNSQLEPLKTQLLGTQRRLVQELENHWGSLLKNFNDVSVRNVALMYASVRHLSEDSTPTVRHMYDCIEQWEKLMAKMSDMHSKFKKTLDVYDKAWKSGKIAEKKLITIQVPTPPTYPDYPIEDILELDLHSAGGVFKKVALNCNASTQTKARKTSDQGVSVDLPTQMVNSLSSLAAQAGTSKSSDNSGSATGARPKVSSATSSSSQSRATEAPVKPKEVAAKVQEVKPTKSAESSRPSTPRVETSIFSSRGDLSSKPSKSSKHAPPPTMADALKGHTGSSVPPVIPTKSKPLPIAKTTSATSKKSNYQVLIDELVSNNYHVTEGDVRAALQVVRERNNNKLTGLAKEEIARRVTEALLEFLLERPETDELCYTDEDLARTLSEGPAEGEEEDCCICMERKDYRNVYLMPCKHSFHPNCLRKWLYEDKFCPMCRQTVNIKLPGNVEEFPPLRN